MGLWSLQAGRGMGATCVVHAEATPKHLAQAPDLRQLPVSSLQAAQRPLAEDVHLGNTPPSSSRCVGDVATYAYTAASHPK